jgi:uncharacterized protein (DUF2336 family)
VSSSDFRQIAIRGDAGKGERLFRAAISAFCCLTRPSRSELAQIEDLTLPLFDQVSVESRRFVAAALSECEYPPTALVRRLCEETVDIAAPLLVRSVALSDIDLIALIGRHGLPHARAIARRKNLNPTISALIKALERPALVDAQASAMPTTTGNAAIEPPVAAKPSAEAVRHRLRAMMTDGRPAGALNGLPRDGTLSVYARLRETALTGNAVFFQTALADALEISLDAVRSVTTSATYSPLLVALRALGLSEDRAFLIAVAIFPKQFPHPQAIRIFLDAYNGLHRDRALEKVRGWEEQALYGAAHPVTEARVVNRPRQGLPDLKAS